MGQSNAKKAVAEPSKAIKSASGKRRDANPVSKPATKKLRLITLLETKGGVTIAQISEELGWLQHTTRAALTGLRKAGFDVASSKPDGGGAGRYSVTVAPNVANAVRVSKVTKVTKKSAASK